MPNQYTKKKAQLKKVETPSYSAEVQERFDECPKTVSGKHMWKGEKFGENRTDIAIADIIKSRCWACGMVNDLE